MRFGAALPELAGVMNAPMGSGTRRLSGRKGQSKPRLPAMTGEEGLSPPQPAAAAEPQALSSGPAAPTWR